MINTGKKRSKPYIHTLIFLISIFFQVLVSKDVIDRKVDNFSLILWLASMAFLYISFPYAKKVKQTEKSLKKIPITAVLIILISLGIRVYFMLDESSFHYDEYLSAYFSYSLGDITKLDWFGVYPPQGIWVSQFPILFFLFQKIFFNIFGLSTFVVRLSTLPYVFITFLALFLVAKELFGNTTAYLSILFLSFFSADLYITRWGLHFSSSTAFFLLSVLFFVKSIKVGKKHHFALLGIFLGLSYMTYYSSYLAAPLLLLYFVLLVLRKKIKTYRLKNFILTLGIFILFISPLITYAVKVDNFFTQRFDQISFLHGDWSEFANYNKERPLEEILVGLKEQFILNFESFYKDGIGGHGEYYFGKLALFNTLTFISFMTGVIYFFFATLIQRNPKTFFILITIFVTFITGMVLTTPPPPFHRFSLAFPFISLLIAATTVDAHKYLKKFVGNISIYLLLAFAINLQLSNLFHFQKILSNDPKVQPDYLKIEKDIVQMNGKQIYIAAFNSYALGPVLFIRSGGKIDFHTEGIDTILQQLPENQSSLLIVHYPDEEKTQKIKERYPNIQKVKGYQTHALFEIR